MTSFLLSLLLPLLMFSCGSVSVNTGAPASTKKEAQEVPVFEGVVMRSLDQGKSWSSFDTNLRPGMEVNAAHAVNGQLYLTDQTRLLSSVADRKAEGWSLDQIFHSWLAQDKEGTRAISDVYSTATRLFVFLPGEGLYWRPLQGGQWKQFPMLSGIAVVRAVVELPGGELFIGTNHGVYSTADEGKNWAPRFTNRFVISLLYSGTTLYAGCSGGFFQSANGGKDWTRVSLEVDRDPGFKGHSDYTITQYGSQWLLQRVDAHQDGNQPGRFQLSDDGGKTWKVHPADETLRKNLHLSNVLEQDGKIFMADRSGIKMSEDKGKTWKQVLQRDEKIRNTTLQLLESNGIWYVVSVRLGC